MWTAARAEECRGLRWSGGFPVRRVRSDAVRALAVLAFATIARASFGQGGPPLITDDPDTPGPRYWEINISFFREHSHADRLSEVPRLDLNYGLGRRIQLKLEGPWLVRKEPGMPSVSGLGNTIAGLKWRLRGEEGQKFAWSVYPQYEFHLGDSSVRKGLVDEGQALFLPTELTLELHPMEMNIEVGRNFVSGGRPDEWLYGLAAEAEVGHGLELLGELHGETPDGGATELILNGGGRYKLTPRVTLMLALGHALAGSEQERPRLLVYAGVQLNLPNTFKFRKSP